MPPRPRGVELEQGDLIPSGQELGVRWGVRARQEGPLSSAQTDEEVMLGRVIHVVAILQRSLAELAALGAEVMLKGQSDAGEGGKCGPEPPALGSELSADQPGPLEGSR